MDSTPKSSNMLAFYITGFVLSMALTLAAYFVVLYGIFPEKYRIITILALGVIQAYVQLTLFLHLGSKTDPESKWHTLSFVCMATVLLILILGSIWIMYNLYERVM